MGVFIRIAVRDQRTQRLNDLIYNWEANNISHKGLKSIIDENAKAKARSGRQRSGKKIKIVKDSSEYTKRIPTEEEAARMRSEWDRLSGAMSKGFK